ncbi:EscU/YscU/HrcU family type III secretion system export apparatus switch protein [Terrilactibacillus sp. S3-3]|nr:EscU/YscU/HrcU family type III secretion system export apparatus switch protein [Terrilactibacillus sp. S3-3]
MSKQDIKDEFKNTEGDPLIRSKVRERQRQMAMKRMMQELPKADVVITNPTHFAVALRYEASEMSAPKVVAKGAGYLALKIKEIARKRYRDCRKKAAGARALSSTGNRRYRPGDFLQGGSRNFSLCLPYQRQSMSV